MDHSGIIALLLLAAALLWWHGAVQARDRARILARHFCQQQGWQLLDQTVALKTMKPFRNVDRWQWRRAYRFDYSPDGAARLSGEIWLRGQTVEQISAMQLDGSRLIQSGDQGANG